MHHGYKIITNEHDWVVMADWHGPRVVYRGTLFGCIDYAVKHSYLNDPL